jgi:hypothetical protein
MTDTPKHIQELQLQLWLNKSPGERLYQFLLDNEVMLSALIETKTKLNIPLGDLDLSNFTSKKDGKI